MIKQMNITTIIRIEATISSIGGIGLLVWWFLMPILLPIADAADYFQNLSLIATGVCKCNRIMFSLIIDFGFPGFYLRLSNLLLGFIGMMVTITGLILYTCIQYYETIICQRQLKLIPGFLTYR